MMYDASVPVFIHFLNGLAALLRKAEAHVQARKLDPDAFLLARLFPDMFTFTKQVQLACDFAKGTSARLAGSTTFDGTDVATVDGEVDDGTTTYAYEVDLGTGTVTALP